MQALGIGLHYGTGITMRKVPELLTAMTGITVTQSSLTQSAIKLGAPEAPLDRAYRNHEICGQAMKKQRTQLHQRLTDHLRPRELADPDAQRLLNGIGERHDNGQLLLFLEHPKIEPSNNSAERGLRGAVIARKFSHRSKNQTGAETHAKIKSIVETLRVRGRDWLKSLAEVIATGIVPAAGRYSITVGVLSKYHIDSLPNSAGGEAVDSPSRQGGLASARLRRIFTSPTCG